MFQSHWKQKIGGDSKLHLFYHLSFIILISHHTIYTHPKPVFILFIYFFTSRVRLAPHRASSFGRLWRRDNTHLSLGVIFNYSHGKYFIYKWYHYFNNKNISWAFPEISLWYDSLKSIYFGGDMTPHLCVTRFHAFGIWKFTPYILFLDNLDWTFSIFYFYF